MCLCVCSSCYCISSFSYVLVAVPAPRSMHSCRAVLALIHPRTTVQCASRKWARSATKGQERHGTIFVICTWAQRFSLYVHGPTILGELSAILGASSYAPNLACPGLWSGPPAAGMVGSATVSGATASQVGGRGGSGGWYDAAGGAELGVGWRVGSKGAGCRRWRGRQRADGK
jgi:hypothetical protein